VGSAAHPLLAVVGCCGGFVPGGLGGGLFLPLPFRPGFLGSSLCSFSVQGVVCVEYTSAGVLLRCFFYFSLWLLLFWWCLWFVSLFVVGVGRPWTTSGCICTVYLFLYIYIYIYIALPKKYGFFFFLFLLLINLRCLRSFVISKFLNSSKKLISLNKYFSIRIN